MADIEAMFHAFYLNPEHRDFLRFYWYAGNDGNRELVLYRARVHIFGNRPSPAVATFGLRHATQRAQSTSEVAMNFLKRKVCVDDGLGSADSVQEAIHILTEARKILNKFNIRLHKITASNSEILDAFPVSEHVESVVSMENEGIQLPRTLGVAWDSVTDSFVIQVEIPERPFTKRGVLSTINTIFDPLGVVSPVTLAGRLIQRSIIPGKERESACLQQCGWDDQLPEHFAKAWKIGNQN